ELLAGTETENGFASAAVPLPLMKLTAAIASVPVGFCSVSELVKMPGTACDSRAEATWGARSKGRLIWPPRAIALATARSASGRGNRIRVVSPVGVWSLDRTWVRPGLLPE